MMKNRDLFVVVFFVVLFCGNLWASRIYWGDGDWGGVNSIKSCNRDGSDVGTVVELDTGHYGPLDIDIHEADSELYWITVPGHIEKCNLDGTDYERITYIPSGWTGPLFVNEVNSKIYFTDTNLRDAICRVDLDGSNYTEIIFEYVKCFDIDPVNSKIYYVTLYKPNPPWDNQAGRIWQANLDGSDKTVIFEYNNMGEWPEQIALNLSAEKVYWTTNGGKFQRANYDGSEAEVIFAPPDFYCSGFVIDEIKNKMYWINHNLKKIERANLDGTNMEDVVTGLSSSPYGIALEPESVCGDYRHPYPTGDLNMDCVVDMFDVALMCHHWLEDNRP